MYRQSFPIDPYAPQIDDARTPFDLSPPQLRTQKQDWRARMFDRMVPQGDANMDEADKSRMFRQGLLQLAAGIQSSPNWTIGLANGLSGGLLSMNKGVDDMQDRQIKKQTLASTMGGGTAFQAKHMQAIAAGYPEGSQGYKDFMRRDNGELARASSAAAQSFEMPDENGVPTRYTFDPKTSGYVKAMVGGTPPSLTPQAPQAVGGNLGPALAPSATLDPTSYVASLQQKVPGLQVTSTYRDPKKNAQVGGVANSFHKTGEAADLVPPREQWQPVIADARANGYEAIDEGDHIHIEPPRRGMTSNRFQPGKPLVGRRKEDEAGAVRAAEKGVDLQYDPAIEGRKEQARIDAFLRNTGQVGAAEAEAAATKAAAQKAAEMSTERTQAAIGDLPKVEA